MKKILILFLIAFTACTPGSNPLEPDYLPGKLIKSALVSTPSPAYRVRSNGKDLINIETIDGYRPTFLESKVVVSPGVHTFQVRMEFWENSKKFKDESVITKIDSDLIFQVEAKKEYLINAAKTEQGVWLWAEDVDTKEVVGGDKP